MSKIARWENKIREVKSKIRAKRKNRKNTKREEEVLRELQNCKEFLENWK